MNKMKITLLFFSIFCWTIVFAAIKDNWNKKLNEIQSASNWNKDAAVPTKKWIDEMVGFAVKEINTGKQENELVKELENKLNFIYTDLTDKKKYNRGIEPLYTHRRNSVINLFREKLKEQISLPEQKRIAFQTLLNNVEQNWFDMPTDNWQKNIIIAGSKLIQLNITDNNIINKVIANINQVLDKIEKNSLWLKTSSIDKVKKYIIDQLQQEKEKYKKIYDLEALIEEAKNKEMTRQDIIKKNIAKRKQESIPENVNEARKRRLQSAIRYDRYKKNIENLRRQIKEIEQGPPG